MAHAAGDVLGWGAPMSALITDLAIVTLVAGLTGMLARWLGQPSILGYLIAGLIVGPYIPAPMFADPARINELAELGVVLVMFAVGLEFRVARLLELLPITGLTAAIEIAALLWAGTLVGGALGWSTAASVCLGATLAISSTMVVSAVLRGMKVDPDARAHVFGVLVIQDVAAILLMTVVTALSAGKSVGPAALLGLVTQLLVVVAVLLFGGVLILPRIVRYVLARLDEEVLVVLVVGAAFGFALAAHAFGYSVALGAFISGMAVAEARRTAQVKRAIEPLRALFSAIFFVSIGMSVDPIAAWHSLPLALALSAVVIGVQFTSVTVASVLSGSALKKAVFSGLALGQIGELSFILATTAIAGGLLPLETLAALVTVSTLTSFTTPLLLRRAAGLTGLLDRWLPSRVQQALAMHQAFVRRLKEPNLTGPSLRRPVLAIILDWGALLLLLLVGGRLRVYVPEAQHLLFIGSLLLLSTPFILGLIRSGRALIAALSALARSSMGAAAAAPISVSALLAVLALGFPTVAVARPLINSGWLELSLLGGGLLALLYFGLRVRDLGGEYHSQVGRIALELAQAVRPEDTIDLQPELAPLVGVDYEVVVVPRGAQAEGCSLAELNLRAETGAMIVAIRRHDRTTLLPTGSEQLAAGDRVALSGEVDAVQRARARLTRPPPAPAPVDPERAQAA